MFCVNADRHNPDVFKSTVDDSFCFDTVGQRPHSVRSCGENGYCTQGVWCVGDYSEVSDGVMQGADDLSDGITFVCQHLPSTVNSG